MDPVYDYSNYVSPQSVFRFHLSFESIRILLNVFDRRVVRGCGRCPHPTRTTPTGSQRKQYFVAHGFTRHDDHACATSVPRGLALLAVTKTAGS